MSQAGLELAVSLTQSPSTKITGEGIYLLNPASSGLLFHFITFKLCACMYVYDHKCSCQQKYHKGTRELKLYTVLRI